MSASPPPTPTPLEALLRTGHARRRALKALASTAVSDSSSTKSVVQLASDWLVAHAHDPALDDDRPRLFHIYLCPAPDSALSGSLQTFWDASAVQVGWNGSHNLSPHITLVAGLAVPDDKVDEFVGVVRRKCVEFEPELAGLAEMSFERYASPNFIGFFVGKDEESVLKSFVRSLADEVSSSDGLGLAIDANGNNESKSSFHLTLAYQFPQKQYAGLQDLACSVDAAATAGWELKLFSCDQRAAMPDVTAYRVVRAQRAASESPDLDVIAGDFVYVSEDSWSSPPEADWVSATSWLTGTTGRVPKSLLAPTAETSTWTVHLSVPLSRVSTVSPVDSPPPPVPKSPAMRKGTSESRRRIFVLRHGERVDFTFGQGWVRSSFERGSYGRPDLNMPRRLPERARGAEGFARDCPLTVVGSIQARMTGEAMREAGVRIRHAYCSPSLRCVETCSAVLAGLSRVDDPDDIRPSIHIEPGLFEWLAFYQDGMPDWMSGPELARAGHAIHTAYKPYISGEELQDAQEQGCTESCEDYYTRNFFVTQCVLAATEDAGGDILFVGHASTLDACARQLTGNDPGNVAQLMATVRKVAYCGVAVLESDSFDGKNRTWTLETPPFGPLTHCSNPRFDAKEMLANDSA